MTNATIAHHGFDTEYDANKKLTLTGVVQKVEWQNPHMRVYVDVTDNAGKVTTWNLEMTSPNTVRRQGWGPKDLEAGEKVTFTTFAGKVVESRGSLVSIKKVSDGRELFTAWRSRRVGAKVGSAFRRTIQNVHADHGTLQADHRYRRTS
jgi:hypothetical protein